MNCIYPNMNIASDNESTSKISESVKFDKKYDRKSVAAKGQRECQVPKFQHHALAVWIGSKKFRHVDVYFLKEWMQ